ncbi:hypothetical protein PFISCL1PPCAC_155, partial [Pristionchus fissidentatus]
TEMTHGTMMEERTHDVDLLPASSSSPATKSVPQVELPTDVVTIELIKDEGGFGFNVVGGCDSQHLPGDNGIFVSLIKEDGVADRDGRLKQGDRIISVNGFDLSESSHDDAVKILREIKMLSEAALIVQQHAELTALSSDPAPNSTDCSLPDTPSLQSTPIAFSPLRPPEDPKPNRSNGSAALSFGAADTVSIKGALFGQGKKKDEDEESIYAPSTHSIIDDVPRTPKKKTNMYEKVTPLLTEVAYVGIGLAAISAACFVVYKIFVRRRQ